ncbi:MULTISPECIES: ABC transporter substrate-binding protein [unclassified Rathayibacter]|uniref:ABC transporter substrate-binding protein n=1 Tax=unclassified Rathayibacter TaxID=2609250 RepID=UPI000F4C03D0|nr:MULTISPECIES: NrtA/SsuA/CpmA family ABC transporter substrate-binding protein [unclassified Rathayibacter]ROP56910.1 NitT/TauT family transport system substrate-binding protein [Rathayibacter sp. PhB186]ROS55295.1 NitT/TauT family transport system substrate-binding protein [Rathayibacter sp. PhB185]
MPLSRPSTRLALGAALAATLSLVACSGASDAASGDGGDTVPVTVGTLRGQPHFYQPFLYEQFAEEGVEFEVITLDTTPALSDALVAGTIDFAISGVTPTIASIAQDRDLKIVASAADGGSGFLGGEGISSVEDLAGKKVGYIQGSAQEVALRYYLDQAELTDDDLELITIPVPEMASAFTSGSIDAFFGVEIGVSIAEAAGGTEIADPYATPIGRVNIGLVTTGAMIEEQPEVVQKVVDTHAATTAYMAESVDEWLPDMIAEFGGDQEVLESALENFWLRSDLSEEYQGQLGALATQMQELGFIDSAPAIEDVVDTSFAPEA